jgi:hypothetical protein
MVCSLPLSLPGAVVVTAVLQREATFKAPLRLAVDGAPENAIKACVLQHYVVGLVGVTGDLLTGTGSRAQQQAQWGSRGIDSSNSSCVCA